jgi:cytochrome c peroxidase
MRCSFVCAFASVVAALAVAVSLADDSSAKPAGGAKSSSSAKSAKVKLGSAELTSGIPGEGALTLDQIKAWLAKPENHVPLEVELEQGLALGASSIYIPKNNPLTRAKIELGRQLYFDPRLSADVSISCATCHDPVTGYAKDTQFGVGIRSQEGNRNSPVAYNRIFSKEQFWDGRAESLEEQAKGPIANPLEMGHTHEGCLECLKAVPGYTMQFDKIFPGEGLTIDTVAKAIASFERVLVTGSSPADYYEPLRAFEVSFKEDLEDLDGFKADDPDAYEQYVKLKADSDRHPISESAKRGRELFFGKANCTACHVGANFSDEKYHNIGVGMEKKDPDLGRFIVTMKEADKGAFKTPTVRNVTLTAPYMHDGSQKTLEEVVEWYDKGGHPNPHLSDKIKKLNLTAQEKKDLVEYMKALTGELPKVAAGRLPQDE